MITRDHIMAAVSASASELVYPAEITEEQKISELAYDYDSLDYLEFVMEIEGRLGVPLKEAGAPDIKTATIGDLALWIEGEVRKAGA